MPKSPASAPRVFIGLAEIAGFYGRIVDSLRDDGCEVSFFEGSQHVFGYSGPKSRIDYRYISSLTHVPGSKWTLSGAIRRRLIGAHFFVWAIRRHDVFVFSYGQSFWRSGLDLLILKSLHKKIVSYVAHGSELRPAYMDGAHWSRALKTSDPIEHIRQTARRQHRLARRLEKWCDVLIAHPLSSQFLRKSAICSPFIGLPIPNIDGSSTQLDRKPSNRIRIIHAPSDRRAKGSDLIAESVNRIQQEFDNIDYVELHGVQNDVVLKSLWDADIVVDQMFTDTRLAGLGAEAASMGVAVLSAGYGDRILSQVVDESLLPPAPVVDPIELEVHLRRLIKDDEPRCELAQRLQEFVLSRWSSQSVAERFWMVVVGESPNEWLFDPLTVNYIKGAGLPQHEMLDIARQGFDRFGPDFFQLDHRPDLLNLILEFCNSTHHFESRSQLA